MSVPQEVLDQIKLREGFRGKVYADTATPPNLTVGWGHKLEGREIVDWPKGAQVPGPILEDWFKADSQKAYDVATSLAQRIGFNDPRLVNALASVCFQLGGVWYKEFKLTWAHLLSHEWGAAADEVRRSKWFRQSPQRVTDFQEVLRSLDLPLPATFAPAQMDANVVSTAAPSVANAMGQVAIDEAPLNNGGLF